MTGAVLTRKLYRYYIVAACFTTLFMLWGPVVNSFAVFFKPIAEDMNWGRGALSLALFMRSIGTAAAGPVAGRMIDRFGARPLMVTGTLLIGIGLLAASRITQLWQLCALFAFVGCGLMCATVIPCALIISNWFVARRGTALGSAFVGTSVGGAVMSPFANWMILEYGWRTAFAVLGLMILAVVLPVILFVVRTRPSEVGLEPYRNGASEQDINDESWGVGIRGAFSSRVFWQIAAIMFIIGFVTNGTHNHSVASLTDLGHTATTAAFLWSFVMFIMIGGKLSFGPIADTWGAKNAMAGAFVLYAASICALAFAEPYLLALVFAALYGFACGAPLTLNPLLTMNNLGIKNFGVLYGILTILASVGGAIGPVVAGAVFDRHGTYFPIFIGFAALMLLGSFCSFSIRPAVRRGQ